MTRGCRAFEKPSERAAKKAAENAAENAFAPLVRQLTAAAPVPPTR
jgi:hypothetical protein